MKLRPIVYAIGITLLASQSANALPNGKPFQELNALIEENASAIDENGALIEQNSTAILSLSAELSALDVRVETLETNVSGLTTRFDTLEGVVTANTNDIALANIKIATLRSDLSDLNAVVDTNTQAIADAEAAIATAESDIVQLNTDLDALGTTVATNEANIAAVQIDIAAAEARLATLEMDVATNAAEIDATNSDLNDLNASLASLEAIVASNTARITQTESQITAGYALINTLTTQYNDLLAVVSANADASDAAIAALKTELSALIAANEVSIADNDTELVALSAALSQLAQDNSDVAQALRNQMLALALLVDSNSTSITALTTQVGTLSGGLATLNAQYNSLSNLYSTLKAHVDDHHIELANLAAAIGSLGVRVGALEELHAPDPSATLTLTDNPGISEVHIPTVRAFFTGNNTAGRWVGAVGATPGINRYTEFCLFDTSGAFSQIYSSATSTYNNFYMQGSMRLNGGTRYDGQLNVRAYSGSSQWVDLHASLAGGWGQLHVYDYTNSVHDIYNTGWHSRYIGSPVTTATYTIADDRLTACGY